MEDTHICQEMGKNKDIVNDFRVEIVTEELKVIYSKVLYDSKYT